MMEADNALEETKATEGAAGDVALEAELTTGRAVAQTAVTALEEQYNDFWARAIDLRDNNDIPAAEALEMEAEGLHE